MKTEFPTVRYTGEFLDVQDARRSPKGRMLVVGISHTGQTYRALYGKPHESGEDRAFRRFPIVAHKPRWD